MQLDNRRQREISHQATSGIDRRRRLFGRCPYQPDLVVPDMAALAAAMV